MAGDAAGVALKKAGSKAVSKIVGAVGERAGAVAAKNAGAKAAQKTLASSAAAGVVGAGADAIPEGKIASAIGGENVYDLLKRKGIPSTLSDEKIAAAKAVDLRMQAGKTGWHVGDPIDNLTRAGNEPSWSTVRSRYWKNEAHYNPGEYSEKT